MEKNEIRKAMLQKRKALTKEETEAAGQMVAMRILSMGLYHLSKTVMLYMDYRNEMPTDLLIQSVLAEGKTLVLPYTDENFIVHAYEIPGGDPSYLQVSPLGILEPNRDLCPKADLSAIDLVVIPGVAFDKQGNRIGFGKGCYDRFLPGLRANVLKVGIAYDFQVQEETLPAEPTDFRMDYVITPSEAYDCLEGLE